MARPARLRWLAVACTWLVAAAGLPVRAAMEPERPDRELDADSAAREALRANLDREAALERIAAARGRLAQAGLMANPELEISGGDDFLFSNDGERKAEVTFSQRFPITARLAREREVAAGELAIAETEVREFERGLVSDVLQAFYGMLAFERRMALNDELVRSLEELEGLSERRLRAAEVSRVDVGLLRVERRRLMQRGAEFGAQRDAARLRLARLMGRPLGIPLRVRGPLEPQPSLLDRDLAGWEERRPDLRAALLAVRRAKAAAGLSRAERYEDWTLRLGVESERQVFDSPRSRERDSKLNLGLVVPLPLRSRNEGAIAAAEADARRAERERSALLLRADEEVRVAQARVAMLRASARAYQTGTLPESNEALVLLQSGYRQGLVGIAELLAAQRQYAEVRDEQLEIIGELRRAQVDLEAAAASSPHLQSAAPPLLIGGSLP